VEDSLAHCLSCKACKTSCPTQVDIASYKSEFMSRHYQTTKRPLSHSVFGKIGDRLPLMARIPRLVNMSLALPLLGSAIRRAVGIDPQHSLPRLAVKGFRREISRLQDELPVYTGEHFHWFGQQDAPKVVLWVDSFNSHYRPQVLEAALRVLSRQNLQVGIVKKHFCCGRPLYEYGMLDEAKDRLTKIVDHFYTHLPDDSKVVVLEPACLSVFKDELLALLGEDPRAVDLANRVCTLADCLHNEGVTPERKFGNALLHLHCHQKALHDNATERALLAQCFESVSEPEPGCCGMAGTFGVVSRTRGLARKVFAKNLKGAVEKQKPDDLVVVSGFSCHEQFTGSASREPVHVAEVFDRCLQKPSLPH